MSVPGTVARNGPANPMPASDESAGSTRRCHTSMHIAVDEREQQHVRFDVVQHRHENSLGAAAPRRSGAPEQRCRAPNARRRCRRRQSRRRPRREIGDRARTAGGASSVTRRPTRIRTRRCAGDRARRTCGRRRRTLPSARRPTRPSPLGRRARTTPPRGTSRSPGRRTASTGARAPLHSRVATNRAPEYTPGPGEHRGREVIALVPTIELARGTGVRLDVRHDRGADADALGHVRLTLDTVCG